MTPETPQQPDALDRFIEKHKAWSVAAAIGSAALILESQNIPAIAAPVAVARHVLHV